jgi:hypothetical protein
MNRFPQNSVSIRRLGGCCLSSFVEPLLTDEISNKSTGDRSLMFW